MGVVEINILGQSFLINPQGQNDVYYKEIAAKLDRLMAEESKKTELRSDVRIAVRVAFILAVENSFLKTSVDRCNEVLCRIEDTINSLDVE